jgi:hypothetical protein
MLPAIIRGMHGKILPVALTVCTQSLANVFSTPQVPRPPDPTTHGKAMVTVVALNGTTYGLVQKLIPVFGRTEGIIPCGEYRMHFDPDVVHLLL